MKVIPFAGIAFLWFIGVLRDRLGELEDRFFATVFLGSGLLFLAIRTDIIARWIAFLGYAFALFLLLSGRYIEWILMLFPLWVLLVSIYILIDNLRRPPQVAAISPGK